MYINTETLEYPFTEAQIRAANPSTLFGVPFDPGAPYAFVRHGEVPAYDQFSQTLEQGDPQENDEGDWVMTWRVVNLPAEEANALREAHVTAIRQSIINEAQVRMDEFARSRDYDSMLSLCSYANSTLPKFKQEAERALLLRDRAWGRLYELLADVMAGKMEMPNSFSDVESLMPALTWED